VPRIALRGSHLEHPENPLAAFAAAGLAAVVTDRVDLLP
jgi:hypothetical protein